MEVSCNTNTSARRCLDLLFQGIFFLFLLTPNRQVRINKMVNSISLKETSFHVSKYKLLRALSLSRMLAEFSLKLSYSTKCGKNFQIYGVHIPGKCTDSRHFHSWSSPLKTWMKMTCNIRSFIFCMICNFSDVIVLQFCK